MLCRSCNKCKKTLVLRWGGFLALPVFDDSRGCDHAFHTLIFANSCNPNFLPKQSGVFQLKPGEDVSAAQATVYRHEQVLHTLDSGGSSQCNEAFLDK